MEILILVLLYRLSQNPDFTESVKPLMEQLKNSEQMLCFLKDLSKFTETFSTFKHEESHKEERHKPPNNSKSEKEKPSASPTAGIANDFIEQILQNYFNK